MKEDITQIQITVEKLQAVLTAISDIAYDHVELKPNDIYADHLLNMIDVASEYAEKAGVELMELEKKNSGFVA